jgi:hypothetical protein
MGWITKLIGSDGVSKPIDAIGNAVDKIFTSDEERLSKAEAMQKLKQALPELQAQLDMLNAKSNVPLVAFARPFCVYVAAVNFVQLGIGVVWFNKFEMPEWYITASTTGFLGALGLYGVARTIEKITGKAK